MELEIFFQFEGEKPQPIKIKRDRIIKYLAKLQEVTGKKIYLLTQKPLT